LNGPCRAARGLPFSGHGVAYYRPTKRPGEEKVMDWFNGKTSIAGIQIPDWLIILSAAVIVILLITSMR
jgi:hypothetical protein